MVYKCPCCGYYTLDTDFKAGPLFDICEVCFWEYDTVAHDKPSISMGANHVSLNEARENYKKYGVSELKFKDKVRAPTEGELPENNIL